MKINYIDDLELTQLLIKEIENRKQIEHNNMLNGTNDKVPGPSERLGEWYIKVVDRLLSRGNFRGYTDNYKDEMKSDAYLFFARYWWKFDATRVKKNYTKPKRGEYKIIDNEKHIFNEETQNWEKHVSVLKPKEELEGGFSYFTTLSWTASVGVITRKKAESEERKEMISNMTTSSKRDVDLEFFTGREINEGY